MLRERAFANLAVIASKLGIFLYPTFVFLGNSCVSLSKVSNFSAVSWSSPGSSTTDVAVEPGADTSRPGDPARVEDGFTTIESVVETREAVEPVRSNEAAKRGRLAIAAGVAFGVPLLRFIRAASWFKEGKRPELLVVEDVLVRSGSADSGKVDISRR